MVLDKFCKTKSNDARYKRALLNSFHMNAHAYISSPIAQSAEVIRLQI